MDEQKYFAEITTDKGWKTIWDIYNYDDVDKSVGYICLTDNDEGSTVSYFDNQTDQYRRVRSLREAFDHWKIKTWDKPLY